MRDLLHSAEENAQALIAAAHGARLEGAFTAPRRAEHGDLCASHALISASRLGAAPASLARRLARRIDLDGSFFSSVAAAGAGFLNFTLGDAWYSAVLDEAVRLGAPPAALAQPETALDVLMLFPHAADVPERELCRRGDMANPVYRVRYAYARMGAVMENRATSAHPAQAADVSRLVRGEERALIRLIAALPRSCARAEERGGAAALCAYALNLADGFYAVYAVPQYFSADERTLAQRLRLLDAARRALGYALDCAGINKSMI